MKRHTHTIVPVNLFSDPPPIKFPIRGSKLLKKDKHNPIPSNFKPNFISFFKCIESPKCTETRIICRYKMTTPTAKNEMKINPKMTILSTNSRKIETNVRIGKNKINGNPIRMKVHRGLPNVERFLKTHHFSIKWLSFEFNSFGLLGDIEKPDWPDGSG